jgi:hypothetical protein
MSEDIRHTQENQEEKWTASRLSTFLSTLQDWTTQYIPTYEDLENIFEQNNVRINEELRQKLNNIYKDIEGHMQSIETQMTSCDRLINIFFKLYISDINAIYIKDKDDIFYIGHLFNAALRSKEQWAAERMLPNLVKTGQIEHILVAIAYEGGIDSIINTLYTIKADSDLTEFFWEELATNGRQQHIIEADLNTKGMSIIINALRNIPECLREFWSILPNSKQAQFAQEAKVSDLVLIFKNIKDNKEWMCKLWNMLEGRQSCFRESITSVTVLILDCLQENPDLFKDFWVSLSIEKKNDVLMDINAQVALNIFKITGSENERKQLLEILTPAQRREIDTQSPILNLVRSPNQSPSRS